MDSQTDSPKTLCSPPTIAGGGIKICIIICEKINVLKATLVNSKFSLPRALKYKTAIIQEKNKS